MNKCPFFSKCGGCKFDFSDSNYHNEKLKLLGDIQFDEIVWGDGLRRRAEFSFLDDKIGFFAAGSNDIVPITKCPLVSSEINFVLTELQKIKFQGSGNILVTLCENGIAIDFNANALFYPAEVKNLPALRITWNGKVIKDGRPTVFGKIFPANGFLQPTMMSEKFLQDFVKENATGKIADLFSGIGTLTAQLPAEHFDSFDSGFNKVRNLFKQPLSTKELSKYETIVLDPPRAGAENQVMQIKNNKTVIYISCNPETWARDKNILVSAGYKLKKSIALDQFIGAAHWEIASVFN